MGKNTSTTRYETLVQLLFLAAAILTPLLVSIFMDLELFSVSKTIFIALCSSINPWLYPPYVYLLINFIIFFIFASSYIHSNTIIFNSPTPIHDHHHHHNNSIESSLVSQNLELGSLTNNDHLKFHTLETTLKDGLKSRDIEELDTFKDRDHDNYRSEEVVEKRELRNTLKDIEGLKSCDTEELDTFKDLDDCRPAKVVEKRELRKSKTFHEGVSGSRWIGRRERYVKILSQEELDRRVEEFICKFKKEKNVEKSESEKGLEFGGVY